MPDQSSGSVPSGGQRTAAPCAPRPSASASVRPLAVTAVRITSGPWAEWQAANRRVTIPHGVAWLEREGVLDNFRRLVGESDAPERRGMVFSDSDLYKTLEAVAWDLSLSPHDEWLALLADSAALLARAQAEDGYLNTYVQAGLEGRFADLADGHELYCAGHLVQAAVACSRVTGDDRLLDVARAVADNLVDEFVVHRRDDTDGHPEIETALVELYRHTGHEPYLTLARRLVDVRGHGVLGTGHFGPAYFQDDVPVRRQTTVAGHAVRALYLMAGVVDVYLETGEVALLEAAERQWASMLSEKTYLTGAVGSRFEGEAFGDAYELPPDMVYGETCASIAALMASWRLLLATGRARYADLIERILYNAFSASTASDRDTFFYVNPVQRRRARPAAPPDAKPLRTDAPGTRAEWFDVACCPPNIMRTVGSLGGYLVSWSDLGLQVHQYVPAVIETQVLGDPVRLSVVTAYPRTGTVTITVDAAPGSSWELALRIPGWSRGATLSVNGASSDLVVDARGYCALQRRWSVGDVVVLHIPVEPRLTEPHPAVDAVRGCVAIERGPVVYCLEKPLATDTALPAESVDLLAVEILTDGELTSEHLPDLLGGTTVVHAQGLLRSDDAWAGAGWSTRGETRAGDRRAAPLTAVPYAVWANRGPSEMRVWVPAATGRAG